MIKEEYIAEEISKIEERRLLVMEMRINARKDVNPIEIDEAYQKYYDLLDKKIEKIKKLSDEDYESKLESDKISEDMEKKLASVGLTIEDFDGLSDEEMLEFFHRNFPKK